MRILGTEMYSKYSINNQPSFDGLCRAQVQTPSELSAENWILLRGIQLTHV
jgi:hypothetical protein